ncbi:MAG: heme biosynthesis protein HemY [Alphaproteobacteria bacterium]|nr:heme biosynthesis protein HemY [Alphaproteobacteria bacterium]
MIRALWFMIKTGLLVALAVWVADRPGTVRIAWLDYELTVHTGFFLLIALFIILLGIFVHGILRTVTGLPENIRRTLRIRRKDKGYRALTLGLAAVAAGDRKVAVYQAYRAARLLPQDKGLPLLLEAQAARLDGREDDAQRIFTELSQNKDAGFLGVRGLLQAAIDSGNHKKALDLAQRALVLYPKQGWILRIVYDHQIKMRRWEEAKTILYRAEKAEAIPAAQASSDRVAILIAQSDEFLQEGLREKAIHNLVQAHKFDPLFVPAVLRLARFYRQDNKRNKAVKLVERAWRTSPHPQFAALWDLLLPPKKAGQPMARLVWFERLLALNPQSAEGHLIVGQIAMEEGLWGEARDHFLKAESIEISPRLYKLQAELEKRSTRNEMHVAALLEKAALAPAEKCWVCRATGRVYEEWSPIALPHGSFNTIVWDYPGKAAHAAVLEEGAPRDGVLDVPSIKKAVR